MPRTGYFSKLIRQAMEQRGISQTELQAETGISQANISRYLSGDHLPRTPEVIRGLSRHLHIAMEDLQAAIRREKEDAKGTFTEPIFGMRHYPINIEATADGIRTVNRGDARAHENPRLALIRQEILALETRLIGSAAFKGLREEDLPMLEKWIAGIQAGLNVLQDLIHTDN